MSTTHDTTFPFTALLGQAALQRALVLLAIDPRIGGVLIDGPRGTAKSTSARALAELLPGGAFVTLPLGATEERLIGTLNVEAALEGGTVQFAPGLLSRAHGGVLYVDEVNLLPDLLVDPLLDVAASGVNVIERDGISHQHAASFALIGTMNPEEGELRPQLLDRFGLGVTVANPLEPSLRRDIVRSRLAFDAQPQAFRSRFATEQEALRGTIARARVTVSSVRLDDDAHAHIAQLCLAANVEGVRADLMMARAARALAAWRGKAAVTAEDIDDVAELALHHRRHADDARPESNTPNDARAGRDTSPESTGGRSGDTWGAMAPLPIVALPSRSIDSPAQKKSP